MTPPTLRVAIIGTGRVASARVRELGKRTDAKLVGVASRTLERARALAEPHSAEAVTDWHALVNRRDVDAVMVCSINQEHSKMCEVALSAGKHVSVDYPLALSLADAERLIALAEEIERVLHVEHIELLSPWFRALQSKLPAIGEALAMS